MNTRYIEPYQISQVEIDEEYIKITFSDGRFETYKANLDEDEDGYVFPLLELSDTNNKYTKDQNNG